jgi:hypothetical protein
VGSGSLWANCDTRRGDLILQAVREGFNHDVERTWEGTTLPDDQFGVPVPDQYTDLTNTHDWHAAPDWQLQSLADWANQVGEGITLTLVVPGGLLSGVGESQQAFLRGTADKTRVIAAESGKGDEVTQAVNRLADTFFENPAELIEAKLKTEAEADREAEARGDDDDTGWPHS